MTELRKMLGTHEETKYTISVRNTDDGYRLDGYYPHDEEVSEGVHAMFQLLVDRVGELELRATLASQARSGREQQDRMRKLLLDSLEAFRLEDGFSSGTMRWDRFYWCNSGISYQTRKAAKRGGFIHLSDTTREHLELMDDPALLETYQLVLRQKSKMM